MSVLGFDIRDYTDPQKILEDSLRQQPPLVLQSSGNGYQPPPPQPQPSVQAPVTVDNATGQPVTAPAGINPAATQQPPPVQIPGTAGPSGVNISSTPAAITRMEGVTNQDRLNAMAMVLGAVGQNNFSQVLGAAQAGLMQKERDAKEYNAQLAQLTAPKIEVKDGYANYTPPMWEVDSNGNYQPRSIGDIQADLDAFYGESGQQRPVGETYTNEQGVVISKRTNLPLNPELAALHEKRGGLTAEEAAKDYKEAMATHAELKGHYMNLATSLQDPDNPFADVSSVFGFMKMLDPRSVVREGEFQTLQNTGSVPNNIFNIFEKASTGGILNEGQQKQLLDYVNRVYDNNKAAAGEILATNKMLFEELQFDPVHLERHNPYTASLQEMRDAAGTFAQAIDLTLGDQEDEFNTLSRQDDEENPVRRRGPQTRGQ